MSLVTHDTLKAMLNNSNVSYVIAVVGRALVAINERQTQDEQRIAHVKHHNSLGFSAADAKSGTLTAKYYLKHGTLAEWQLNKWLKPAKNGYPRLCKYAKQLNEIAQEKRDN